MAKREVTQARRPVDAASDRGVAPASEPVADVVPEPVTNGDPVAEAVSAEVSGDYAGKQHYPRAVYGKYRDGTVVVEKVEDKAAHDQLLKESPEMGWADSPAAHGLETAPAGAPVESVKHAGIVGKV